MPDPTEFGERALSAAQDLIRRGQEVAKRESRVIRLQTQISRLRAHRAALLTRMGEKVYDLFERDLVKNQDLRMMCQQIRTLDSDIALRREEIEGIRKPGGPTEGGIERETIEDAEDEIIRG
jgi:hypothetical protein